MRAIERARRADARVEAGGRGGGWPEEVQAGGGAARQARLSQALGRARCARGVATADAIWNLDANERQSGQLLQLCPILVMLTRSS